MPPQRVWPKKLLQWYLKILYVNNNNSNVAINIFTALMKCRRFNYKYKVETILNIFNLSKHIIQKGSVLSSISDLQVICQILGIQMWVYYLVFHQLYKIYYMIIIYLYYHILLTLVMWFVVKLMKKLDANKDITKHVLLLIKITYYVVCCLL
jgi:hypothetical protein